MEVAGAVGDGVGLIIEDGRGIVVFVVAGEAVGVGVTWGVFDGVGVGVTLPLLFTMKLIVLVVLLVPLVAFTSRV